jgi:aspartate kinase
MGDTTDEIIDLANKITDNPPEREMDMLLSRENRYPWHFLAMAIDKLGEQAISFTRRPVGIYTDKNFTKRA